jgi:hypothetical protein
LLLLRLLLDSLRLLLRLRLRLRRLRVLLWLRRCGFLLPCGLSLLLLSLRLRL